MSWQGESGCYPQGAEYDSNAPWNMDDCRMDFELCGSFKIGKCVDVYTDHHDNDGRCSGSDAIDAWEERHFTPDKLIAEFKKLAEKMLDSTQRLDFNDKLMLARLVDECDGWELEECEINEV